MKKIVFYLLEIIFISFFYGCDCNKKYTCGALSADGLKWVATNQKDTLRFVNSTGQKLNFFVVNRYATLPVEKQACKHGPIGCSCQYDCQAYGTVSAQADGITKYSGNYLINFWEKGTDKVTLPDALHIELFDFYSTISLSYPEMNSTTDSLVNLMMVGIHTYPKVYISTLDTLNPGYQNLKIWKVYFSQGYGIVGFKDRLTNSLFYLE